MSGLWRLLVLCAVPAVIACTTAPTMTFSSASQQTATQQHLARLTVVGDGELACPSPGACGAALLLQSLDAGELPNVLHEIAPMQFAVSRPDFEHAIVAGPVSGAPTELRTGSWRVGLGFSESSDVARNCSSGCASPDYEPTTVLLCQEDFTVDDSTRTVRLLAHFGPPCSIEIETGPPISGVSAPTHSALLDVRAKGECGIIDFGRCFAVLLLTRDPGYIAAWTPAPDEIVFPEKDFSLASAKVFGSPDGFPQSIAAGQWLMAIAVDQKTDLPTQPARGTVLCQTRFDVEPATDRVFVEAVFGSPCSLDVTSD